MRWLVTGATGFVGGRVVERLRAEGQEVVALVRREAQAEALRARDVEAFVADLSDPKALMRAATGVARVVHAAAETRRASSERALGWVNVAGTDNLVRACRAARVQRFVHLSCADVTLHERPRMGWNEDKALSQPPVGAYAATKLAAEGIVIGGARDGFETVALRPAWVWGAGDVQGMAGLAREVGEGGVIVFGAGDCLLATTHVDNLVEALWLAATRPEASGAVYHVVDAEMVLARDFLGEIAGTLGGGVRRLRRPLLGSLGLRLGGDRATLEERCRRGVASSLDQQRVIRDLGYAPPVSMADGMEALKRWVDGQGGAAALASRERAPATDADVAAQRRLAGEHEAT